MIYTHYIKETFQRDLYSSKAFDFYFKDLSIGVLDIETTGLSADCSSFILGGLISYKEKCFEQYFVEKLSEEKYVLEKFIERLRLLDVIITYNGHGFDIPFILKRAKTLGIKTEFHMPYNLDLYLVLNGHSCLRQFLPDLKQKTVETFMGLWAERLDEISGRESVLLYYSYLNTLDIKIRDIILLHNKDDVFQLSLLLPVIEKTDFHKAMHNLGFITKIHAKSDSCGNFLKVNKISLKGNQLAAEGFQGKVPVNYSSFGNARADYKIDFKKETCSFSISIPLQSFEGNLFLDMRKTLDSFHELEKYAFFENDFLIIKSDDNINYLETNHFLKLFLKNIIV